MRSANRAPSMASRQGERRQLDRRGFLGLVGMGVLAVSGCANPFDDPEDDPRFGQLNPTPERYNNPGPDEVVPAEEIARQVATMQRQIMDIQAYASDALRRRAWVEQLNGALTKRNYGDARRPNRRNFSMEYSTLEASGMPDDSGYGTLRVEIHDTRGSRDLSVTAVSLISNGIRRGERLGELIRDADRVVPDLLLYSNGQREGGVKSAYVEINVPHPEVQYLVSHGDFGIDDELNGGQGAQSVFDRIRS